MAGSLRGLFSPRQKAIPLDILFTCAITLPYSLTFAFEPFYLDSAIFIYIGDMWIRGVIPYLQLFDNKPPGIFALTALASSTHHSLWVLAIIQFLFVITCVFALRRTLQIAGAPRGTLCFGTVVAALLLNLHFYSGGNLPELYMLPPMTASMLAFVCALKTSKLRFVFLAGVCSGMGCIFKPFALSILAAQIVFVIFRRGSKLREKLASVLLNGCGAIAAWIPAVVYFGLHGALKQMLDASFFYNLHYGAASQPKFVDLLIRVVTILVPMSAMVGSIFIGLAVLRRPELEIDPDRRALWQLTLLWFGFGLALVLMAGRGYAHYFLSLFPCLALGGALVYWLMEDVDLTPGSRLAIWILMLSPLSMAYVPELVELTQDYANLALHREKTQPVNAATTELTRIAKPASTVFVWGFQPYVLYASHLRSAFRYPTSHYIYDSPRAYAEVGGEVLQGMHTNPPDFVVLTPEKFQMNWPHTSDPVQDEFRRVVRTSYTKVWEQYAYELYRRN